MTTERERVKAIVRQCRYPGWRIRVLAFDIEIAATNLMDTDHPSRKPVEPPRAYVVDFWRYRTDKGLATAIFNACARLAHHEVEENFRFRGRRLFDPHPGVKR